MIRFVVLVPAGKVSWVLEFQAPVPLKVRVFVNPMGRLSPVELKLLRLQLEVLGFPVLELLDPELPNVHLLLEDH
jgi:hypothetical protein